MRIRKHVQRGSATIEAVASLTIFIVAIMTILSFINICRAQAAVSHAVDAAAREMSQYAYLYHLTGLDSYEQNLNASLAKDREKVDAIVGGTEAFYEVFKTIGSGEASLEDIGNVVEQAVNESDEDTKQNNISGTTITMENAGSLINEMIQTMSSIDNPMKFFKRVAAIGAVEGASFLRSQLIAVPFAQILVKKHFEVDGMDADTYLRTLNIDGMDALNFKMSTIFAPATPNDIHLVCYYQMKPVKFFNFEFGTITLCKESVTRAWLGGDHGVKEEKKEESGIWDMPSLQYGKYIVNEEKKVLDCYDASGTGVDAFDAHSNTLYHIRSMDIYSETYQADANAVKNTLFSEYSKLVSASEKSGDTIRIKEKEEKKDLPSDPASRRLHMIIVIPEGMKTEAFEEGLKLFQEKVSEEVSEDSSSAAFTYEVKQGYGTSPNNRETESGQEDGEQEGENG